MFETKKCDLLSKCKFTEILERLKSSKCYTFLNSNPIAIHMLSFVKSVLSLVVKILVFPFKLALALIIIGFIVNFCNKQSPVYVLDANRIYSDFHNINNILPANLNEAVKPTGNTEEASGIHVESDYCAVSIENDNLYLQGSCKNVDKEKLVKDFYNTKKTKTNTNESVAVNIKESVKKEPITGKLSENKISSTKSDKKKKTSGK